MKLYTEEDVLQMLRSFHTSEINVQLCMLKLTPIKLPSDEEIEEYVKSTGYYGHCTHEYHEGIEEGAKYVINKIQGGNK